MLKNKSKKTQNLVTIAKTKGAILRKRKLPSGRWTIFIDCPSRKPRLKYLKLFLVGDKIQDDNTQQLALQAFNKFSTEMLQGKLGVSVMQKSEITLVEFYRVKFSTSNYNGFARNLTKLLGANFKLQQVDVDTLHSIRKMAIETYTTNTASAYFHTLRISLNQAFKQGLLTTKLSDLVPNIKSKESIQEFLTIEEVRKLANTSIPKPKKYENKFHYNVDEIKRAFLFSVFCGGLRFSDLSRLTFSDIRNGKISIEQYKTKRKVEIPITEQSKVFIGDEKEPKDKVFNLPSSAICWHRLKAWAQAAGIKKKLHMHVARHTFATLALNSGVDIYTVSKLLGHATITQSETYAKLLDKSKQEAMLKLPTLEV